MVAQVAADEPETAAKIVQPMTLVCSSRPGTRSSHGASPRNMSSESRVRNRISPIQTNSGSAVSVHDDELPQIVTAIASPAGRELKSSMPIQRDARQREPDPHAAAEQREQRDDQQQGDERFHGSFVEARLVARRAAGASRLQLAARARRASATSSTTVPSAIASCGIHSGVASLPVEMSLNCQDWNARRTL